MIIAAFSLGSAHAETVPCPKAVPSPSLEDEKKNLLALSFAQSKWPAAECVLWRGWSERRAAVVEAEGHKSDAAAIIY